MTSRHVTAAQAAAHQREWTTEQWAAYHVGVALADAFHVGATDGIGERFPYGDLSGRTLGGLMDALQLTGPEMPRTNVAYRAMLADAYRRGRRRGFAVMATEWTAADDEDLAELAELGYDDEATS